VILDNIKHHKATLKQLLRCFKIANQQATNAFPSLYPIVATWIYKMFKQLEPIGFCVLLPSQVITKSQDYDITIITAY
jgi:hypothetical protein